ncbi:MAG TPA: hypothetical protein VM491_20545 [Burkholderiaceae bacterium]|nr:hypothetical protein [Burkholderiaceae bacterium]
MAAIACAQPALAASVPAVTEVAAAALAPAAAVNPAAAVGAAALGTVASAAAPGSAAAAPKRLAPGGAADDDVKPADSGTSGWAMLLTGLALLGLILGRRGRKV